MRKESNISNNMSHIWSKSGDASKYYGIHKRFICHTCDTIEDDFESFKKNHGDHAGTFKRSKKSLFEQHHPQQRKKSAIDCSMCGKGFTSQSSVNRHVKQQREDGELVYVMLSKSPMLQFKCKSKNELMRILQQENEPKRLGRPLTHQRRLLNPKPESLQRLRHHPSSSTNT